MLMPTSLDYKRPRDKGCEGHLSGMLNPGTQLCLLSGYLDLRQENVLPLVALLLLKNKIMA